MKLRNRSKKSKLSIGYPILSIVGLAVITIVSSFYEEGWVYNWSGIRPQIKDSILVFERQGISSSIGSSGKNTWQLVESRYWVMNEATTSELLQLTRYPNGTIKATAYEGLLRKSNFDPKFDLVMAAMDDTDYPVSIRAGCSYLPLTPPEYLVDFVLHIREDLPPVPGEMHNPFKFTKPQREMILAAYYSGIKIE